MIFVLTTAASRLAPAIEKKPEPKNARGSRKRKISEIEDEVEKPAARKAARRTQVTRRIEPVADDPGYDSEASLIETIVETKRTSSSRPTTRSSHSAATTLVDELDFFDNTSTTATSSGAPEHFNPMALKKKPHAPRVLAPAPVTIKQLARIPISPSATEVVDHDGPDFVRTAKALGIKVRDFAHEPPKPNAMPSPELFSGPFYLLLFLDVHYRRPWDEAYFLCGKNLRRLLDIGYVSEEEKEKYWTERDKRILAQYDTKPKYPYIICHPDRKLPKREFRIAMRKLVYGVVKDEVPDEQFDIPDGEWEGDAEVADWCRQAAEGWPKAYMVGGRKIEAANKWRAGTHFQLTNFPWPGEFKHGLDDSPFFGSKENPCPESVITSKEIPKEEMERHLAAGPPKHAQGEHSPTPTPPSSPEPPQRRIPFLCEMRSWGSPPRSPPPRHRGLGRSATLSRFY